MTAPKREMKEPSDSTSAQAIVCALKIAMETVALKRKPNQTPNQIKMIKPKTKEKVTHSLLLLFPFSLFSD